MLIQVYPHRIVLNKTNEVNSGEYNVNECTFEFSQEYEGLTKVAVFSLCDGTTKNVTILNNECTIPVECLQETGQVQIGVYGYVTENGNLVLRYSPTPQNFVVRLGSYKEGTQPVAPTPTDWEILVEQVSNISEDVSSIHEDITGINGEISDINIDISNINDDIDAIGTQITGINVDIKDLQDTKVDINDLADVAFTGEFSDLNNVPSYATTQQLNQEIQNRQDADSNLQSQIDAISVSSDVVDVVGTYQELLDYDTQHLKDNDIVKVLQDSTHNDALSYYRWDKETSTWSYIGSEGPFYTKSETETLISTELAPYVKNTDYATENTGGVVRAGPISSGYEISQTGNTAGRLGARILTYTQYRNNLYTNGFVGKGTLENVLNARIGDISSVIDAINGEVV